MQYVDTKRAKELGKSGEQYKEIRATEEGALCRLCSQVIPWDTEYSCIIWVSDVELPYGPWCKQCANKVIQEKLCSPSKPKK